MVNFQSSQHISQTIGMMSTCFFWVDFLELFKNKSRIRYFLLHHLLSSLFLWFDLRHREIFVDRVYIQSCPPDYQRDMSSCMNLFNKLSGLLLPLPCCIDMIRRYDVDKMMWYFGSGLFTYFVGSYIHTCIDLSTICRNNFYRELSRKFDRQR